MLLPTSRRSPLPPHELHAQSGPATNHNRNNGRSLPASSASVGLLMMALLVLGGGDASAVGRASSSLWPLLHGRGQGASLQPKPYHNNVFAVPFRHQQLRPVNLRPDPNNSEDVEELEYEDFPDMPEFLRRVTALSSRQQQHGSSGAFKPLGRKRYLGMDIPDYIASAGGGTSGIKSMSDRMKSLGKKG